MIYGLHGTPVCVMNGQVVGMGAAIGDAAASGRASTGAKTFIYRLRRLYRYDSVYTIGL